MSIEKMERKNGHVWRVRWRDGNGQERTRVLGLKRDAEAFDAEIKRAKRLGNLDDLVRPNITLAKFVEIWWERYAKPHLAERTKRSYAGLWDRHVLPYLGDSDLRALTVDRIEAYASDLRAAGLGDPTIYRALTLLQGVLQRAVEWGYLGSNPAKNVRKPRTKRKRMVRPLMPEEVDKIIEACTSDRDRLIVSLLAYEGLRPQEVLALDWQDLVDGKLVVDKAIEYDGDVKETKTEQHRRVPISNETAVAWEVLWSHSGGPASGRIVLSTQGRTFNDGMWQTWHRDVWIKVRPDEKVRPYDLRHTFVSRLISEGKNILEVAKLAGHSPTMTLEVYGHLFDD